MARTYTIKMPVTSIGAAMDDSILDQLPGSVFDTASPPSSSGGNTCTAML